MKFTEYYNGKINNDDKKLKRGFKNMFIRLSVTEKSCCALVWCARLEIEHGVGGVTDTTRVVMFSLFLPFLLRSIAASKRTSSSPLGKTGTTQRGLTKKGGGETIGNHYKYLKFSKMYSTFRHLHYS